MTMAYRENEQINNCCYLFCRLKVQDQQVKTNVFFKDQNQEDTFFEDIGIEDETKINESLATERGQSSEFSVTHGSKGL